MSDMLDYGFNMYKINNLLKKGKVVGKYIDNKSSSISTKVITNESINVLNKKGKPKRKITYNIKMSKKKLPIKKGDVVGKLIAKENGKKIFESNVVASKRIKKANIVELYLRYIGEFIGGYYIFNSSN
jgi:D-alanyl-D-alanine carboxypeptidase (penicillin-binding protein 5/6)